MGQFEFLTYCVTSQKIQTDPLRTCAKRSRTWQNHGKPRKAYSDGKRRRRNDNAWAQTHSETRLVGAGGGGEGCRGNAGLLEEIEVGADESVGGFLGAATAEFFFETSDEKQTSFVLGI